MAFNTIEQKSFKILKDLNIAKAENIEIDKIAESLGIDVKGEELDDDISGLFVMKNGKPFIRFNNSEGQKRRRFTIAHELGHYVLHREGTPLFVDKKNEKTLYRNSTSSSGEVKREREANAFAASLLMPEAFISDEMRNIPLGKNPITHLANVFNVSEQAMSFRLSNLGYDFNYYDDL